MWMTADRFGYDAVFRCKRAPLKVGRPVRPSVAPSRLFIFGDNDVLLSTAWPVLALVLADMAVFMSNFPDFDEDQIS